MFRPENSATVSIAPLRDSIEPRSSAGEARAAASSLLWYCRSHDWSGHDPYDALNSEIFTALPFLDKRIPRLIFIQTLKRSPIDVRRLLRIPKTQNPKAIGLFLSALLRLSPAATTGRDQLVRQMAERLVALRSPHPRYACWGYSFPWQTRTVIIPRGTPNLVCTSFAANALMDANDWSPGPEHLAPAVSAAEYVLNELYWQSGSTSGFAYPSPSARVPIHNANLLGAALLCRAYRLTGQSRFLEAALAAARYSAGRQRRDGSWAYGEGSTQQWVDNFHTGYNLCALHAIGGSLGTAEFAPVLRRGFEFYRDHFFEDGGIARYFHHRTYPIDIHSVAQSIITLVTLRDLDPRNLPLAEAIFRWSMAHMWDSAGFFYYRVYRLGTDRTLYMRWSQAWMLLALATLGDDSAAAETCVPGAAALA